MKATELKSHLNRMIEKYGEDIEVFIDAPGMNYEQSFSTKKDVGEFVSVEKLSDYKKELVFEYHGNEGDLEGPGLIYAVVLVGDELIDTCG